MLWLIPAADTMRDYMDELTYQTTAALLLVKNHFINVLFLRNEDKNSFTYLEKD